VSEHLPENWLPIGHLPECFLADPIPNTGCICDRLRVAEQRRDREWMSTPSWARAHEEGRIFGLDIAREAVEGTGYWEGGPAAKRAALAAIDALKAVG
jgi:hypothetical protein